MGVEQLYRGLGSEMSLKANAIDSIHLETVGTQLRMIDTLAQLKGLTTGNMAITSALSTISRSINTLDPTLEDDDYLKKISNITKNTDVNLNAIQGVQNGRIPYPNEVNDLMSKAVMGLSIINKILEVTTLTVDKTYERIGNMGKDDLIKFETYKRQYNNILRAKGKVMDVVIKNAKNQADRLLEYEDMKYKKILPNIIKMQIAQIDVSMLMNPSELMSFAHGTASKVEQAVMDMLTNKAKEILKNIIDNGIDLDELMNLVTDPPNPFKEAADAVGNISDFMKPIAEQVLVSVSEKVMEDIENLTKIFNTLYAQVKALGSQLELLMGNSINLADALSGNLLFGATNEVVDWMMSAGLLDAKAPDITKLMSKDNG